MRRLMGWFILAVLALLAFVAFQLRSNLLAHAVTVGNLRLARFALAVGADPDARTSGDEWVGAMESMIGAELHEVNRSPLIEWAAFLKRSEMVRLLLSAGADPNARDRTGATALRWVAHNNDVDSVKLLLGAGANPNATWKDGSTILDDLSERDHPQVVGMLKRAGAKY